MGHSTANIGLEIREIGKLISSAMMIESVRSEVAKVKNGGFVVTDGKHYSTASGYQVIVRCGKDGEEIARRIRAGIQNVDVDKIAEDVLGVKTARRGTNLKV